MINVYLKYIINIYLHYIYSGSLVHFVHASIAGLYYKYIDVYVYLFSTMHTSCFYIDVHIFIYNHIYTRTNTHRAC